MAQAGGDVDIAGRKGPQLERLGPPGDYFGHLYGVHAAGELVGHENDGLGGVTEHRFHLVAVRGHSVHVRGQEHGHDKVNVRQGVAHDHALDDVLHHRLAALPAAMVYHVEAVRAWSKVATRLLQKDSVFAVAVVQRHPLGDRAKGFFHQASGDADQVPIRDSGPRLFHQIERLLLVEPRARAGQDFEAGIVQLLALIGR